MPDLLHGLVLREDPSEPPIVNPYTPRRSFYIGSPAVRIRGVYANLMTRGNAVVPMIRVGPSMALQQSGQLITLALA